MAQEWTRKNNEVVLAHTFSRDADAQIARTILADHGIECILDNDIFSGILPIGFNSIGGIRLMVRADDLQRAKDLIDSMRLGD